MFPLTFNPNLIILPFKASLRDTGQPLAFSQAATLVAQGDAEAIRIERSYRGAAEAIGWTIFERARHDYVHTGKPLFEAEREARQHLRKA